MYFQYFEGCCFLGGVLTGQSPDGIAHYRDTRDANTARATDIPIHLRVCQQRRLSRLPQMKIRRLWNHAIVPSSLLYFASCLEVDRPVLFIQLALEGQYCQKRFQITRVCCAVVLLQSYSGREAAGAQVFRASPLLRGVVVCIGHRCIIHNIHK